MSSSTRQLRYKGMLQANLEKIINDGVRFNLKKLDHCTQNIAKFKARNQVNELKREYMNGKLLIQRLELSVKELQNCYSSLKSADVDRKLERIVTEHEREVNSRIRAFNRLEERAQSKPVPDINSHIDEKSTSMTTETSPNFDLGVQLHKDASQLVDSRERLRKVQALNENIEDLNTIAVNLATLVHEQQETVDNIENNVTQTAADIEEGTKSLVKASTYATVAPITCAAIGGVVLGPVGAIIGLKLSAGIISALGGSAVSYTVAKFVQNHKKEIAEKDLKSISSK